MSATVTVPIVPGYKIERPLGSGAYGHVFLAREQHGLARPVALKVFSPEQRGAYLREIEILRRVEELRRRERDPHIVQSLASGEYRGGAFIAFEYLEAGSLAQYVEAHGPLDVTRAVAHVVDAAHGVARLHGDGLYHRDLKPQNLLIGSDGRVRLGDFGLARDVDASASAAGSPAYAAPEVIAGRRDTDGRRVDVYGLGAVLYFLLVGHPMLSGRPDVFVLERASVPRNLQAVILRATSFEPGERFADAGEFLLQLQTVQDSAKKAANPEDSRRGSPGGSAIDAGRASSRDSPGRGSMASPDQRQASPAAPANGASDTDASKLAPGDVIADRYERRTRDSWRRQGTPLRSSARSRTATPLRG